MIYRIGVKGDDEGLQSVDACWSVSSLLVAFRSGFCLQQAEVTGEKPAPHSRQEKAVGYSWPGEDKHGLKIKVTWLLAGRRRADVLISFLPVNTALFVDVAGWPPWFFLEMCFQLRKRWENQQWWQRAAAQPDQTVQHESRGWPSPWWDVGADVPGQHVGAWSNMSPGFVETPGPPWRQPDKQ